MKKIRWNLEKNQQTYSNPDRGLSLELIAERIQNGDVLDIIVRNHYPDQHAFVVSIDNEVWCVPYREDDETIFLITAWPDRKLRRKYL